MSMGTLRKSWLPKRGLWEEAFSYITDTQSERMLGKLVLQNLTFIWFQLVSS